MAHPVILSTKKLSLPAKELLARHGVDLKEFEFIMIRYLQVPISPAALHPVWVFTSRHGVAGLLENSTEVHTFAGELFCLSGSTKEEALKLKIPITATAENAAALAHRIVSSGKKAVTFFCGKDRRPDLARILRENGISVEEITVYETIANPLTISFSYDAVLFFSPSAVENFFTNNVLLPSTLCCCIGDTTASALHLHTRNTIAVASRPSQEAVVQTVINMIINRNNPVNA